MQKYTIFEVIEINEGCNTNGFMQVLYVWRAQSSVVALGCEQIFRAVFRARLWGQNAMVEQGGRNRRMVQLVPVRQGKNSVCAFDGQQQQEVT